MTVANLFLSSVYSHEGCYKSTLLLTATRHIRNGTGIAREVCIRGSFENEVQLSLSGRSPQGSHTMTDALLY